ncbi:MAG: L,D-transpeptidase family protein [Desulfomonile tiedjei]|nr:L,D-transpeptidase family protein [Desulfomonile tiedjei]
MKMRKRIILTLSIVLMVLGLLLYFYGRAIWFPYYLTLKGKRTVDEVVSLHGPKAEQRLRPCFQKCGVAYPPAGITLVALKEEMLLELWARQRDAWTFVKTFDVKEASGRPGPKLREGDRQVPEGFYRIVALNPNSNYHLSMKLNYPNAFDQEQAKLDGRQHLGGDIFIHGKALSIGCLAMGDEAIEELFVLTARIGMDKVSVIIAPRDLRNYPPAAEKDLPPWVKGLWRDMHAKLRDFRP